MRLLFLRSYLEPLQPLRLIINKVRQAEKKRRNGRVNVRRGRDNSSSCRWNTTVILLTSDDSCLKTLFLNIKAFAVM